MNIIHADYNNDGWPDILVLRGGWWGKFGNYPVSLLRNNGPNAQGQITFTDVTEEAGLLTAHPTQTAAWADYDNDGWLDLMIGHESSTEDPHGSELFHNNHDGTFTNVAEKMGVANLRYVKGVAWGDFNNDGRPDLYVSRKGAPNLLFRNDGDHFTDVTWQAGVPSPSTIFGTYFFDYDNDGNSTCWSPATTSIPSTTFPSSISACPTKPKSHASITTTAMAPLKTSRKRWV